MFLLAADVIAVICLAHASPPDPTWIPGFYDDGDLDDAVVAMLNMDGVAIGFTLVLTTLDVARPLSLLASSRKSAAPLDLAFSRAPPLA